MTTFAQASGSVTVKGPDEPLTLLWNAIYQQDDEEDDLTVQKQHVDLLIGSSDAAPFPIEGPGVPQLLNHVSDTYPSWCDDADAELGVDYAAVIETGGGVLKLESDNSPWVHDDKVMQRSIRVTLSERSTRLPVRAFQLWLGSAIETLYRLEQASQPPRRSRRRR